MKGKREQPGVLLQPDDLAVGQLVTVHHWLDARGCAPRGPAALSCAGMGVAHRVKAINLPYLGVVPLPARRARPIVFDVRRLRLMEVSADFARAQEGMVDTSDEGIPF